MILIIFITTNIITLQTINDINIIKIYRTFFFFSQLVLRLRQFNVNNLLWDFAFILLIFSDFPFSLRPFLWQSFLEVILISVRISYLSLLMLLQCLDTGKAPISKWTIECIVSPSQIPLFHRETFIVSLKVQRCQGRRTDSKK